jgi:alginate O-acetyltransferase complex protein AlgI
MVFSSQAFLYGFLPIFFALYYGVADRFRNGVLLAASLTFYTVGAGPAVLVLFLSVWLNQFLAVRIAKAHEPRRRRLVAAGVALNLLSLAYYKYTDFLLRVVGKLVLLVHSSPLPEAASIPLPVGISFFTFQAISYLIDVHRRETPVASGYFEFAVYHTLFPQLVAGPIVRYREVRSGMQTRRLDQIALAEGAYRFCLGLGKKLIIADNIGTVADTAFTLPTNELGCVQAWLGILCYSLQIYFDFSGYSDMAIGLGRMLGFHFPENFDQPYRSASITEFWRRWHMTLSRWFRDYVYISLGGNRHGKARTFANLWIVFFLCGLWHGAGATFIVWGLYHGTLLVIERLANTYLGWRPGGLTGVVGSFLLVTIGWVFFRAPTLGAAMRYLEAMFLLRPDIAVSNASTVYLAPDVACYLVLGLIFAFAPFHGMRWLRFDRLGVVAGQLAVSFLSFAYSLLMLAANSFNPFIYFRF